MAKEGVDFPEAVRLLARRAGIPVAQLSSQRYTDMQQHRAVQDVLMLAANYYQDLLMGNSRLGKWGRDYLQRRGISLEATLELKLGVASGSGLVAFLQAHGVGEDMSKSAGLVYERNGQLREFFRGRIMFPCLRSGKVIWLVGRSVSGAEPKYLGLPTPKSLYASTLRQGANDLIVVEGPFDAIPIWGWGYSTVALLGTSCKDDWLPVLNKAESIYVCLDTDVEGKRAALDLAERLFPKSKVVRLPEGINDPCRFVDEGHTRDEFADLLTQGQDYVEHQVSQIPADVDKVKLPDVLRPCLKLLASLDPAKSEAYLRHRIAPRFSLKERDLSPYTRTLRLLEKEVPRRHCAQKGEDETADVTPPVEATPAPVMSDNEKEEALALLRSPNLIVRIIRDLTSMGVVGETENKLLVYVVATSRKSNEPLGVIVRAASSAGKNYLVRGVASLIPHDEVVEFTRITPKALDYLDTGLSHKWLVITERSGADEADYSIRVLQSEKVIKVACPVRDPETGRMETVEHEVKGPVAYTETTTRATINPENATRVFTVYLDESADQTKRIHEAQRKGATREGLEIDEQRAETKRRHQNAQRLLEDVEVVVPYADFIRFPNDQIRTRRDFPRFLQLIKQIAFIRQYQKTAQVYHKPDGSEVSYIEADGIDYALAYRYGRAALRAALDDLAPQSRFLLTKVLEMVSAAESPAAEATFTRRQLRAFVGLTDSYIKKYFPPLEDQEFVELASPWSQGGTKHYRLARGVTPAQSEVKGLTTPSELREALRLGAELQGVQACVQIY